jgi:hypothetical protein
MGELLFDFIRTCRPLIPFRINPGNEAFRQIASRPGKGVADARVPYISDNRPPAAISNVHFVIIGHGQSKAGTRQQVGSATQIDLRMDMRNCPVAISSDHQRF